MTNIDTAVRIVESWLDEHRGTGIIAPIRHAILIRKIELALDDKDLALQKELLDQLAICDKRGDL